MCEGVKSILRYQLRKPSVQSHRHAQFQIALSSRFFAHPYSYFPLLQICTSLVACMWPIRADPSDRCCPGMLHLTFTLNGPMCPESSRCPDDIAIFIVSQLFKDTDNLLYLYGRHISELLCLLAAETISSLSELPFPCVLLRALSGCLDDPEFRDSCTSKSDRNVLDRGVQHARCHDSSPHCQCLPWRHPGCH